MRTSIRSFTPLIGLTLLAACATSSPTRDQETSSASRELEGVEPSRSSTSPAEWESYQEIHTLYTRNLHDSVLKRAQSFKKKYPSSPLSPQVENLNGLSYLLTRRPLQAIHAFKKALSAPRLEPRFKQHVMFNLTKSYFDAHQPDDALQASRDTLADQLDTDTRSKFHYLKGKIHAQLNQADLAIPELVHAAQLLPAGQPLPAGLITLVENQAQAVRSVEVLEQALQQSSQPSLREPLLFYAASLQAAAGRKDQASAHLKTLLELSPQGPYAARAADRLRSLDTQSVSDPRAIGVLFPLSGRYAKFGIRHLQAVQLAIDPFSHKGNDSGLTLYIEDSGEEPAQAIQALNKLVQERHVSAVLGPLLSKGIDPITQRARELGVPLISLARMPGNDAEWTFQAGLTLKLQTREIARFAVEKLGLKSFAIVAPRDKSGEELTQQFWEAVEAAGGKIVGSESYATGETDFRQLVDKLSGLYYPEARQRELDALAREREASQIKKRNRRTEKFFSLPPLVDYDAVFVADDPRVSGQIIPTFAYRDVDKIKFLGTSLWNSPEMIERFQTAAESSYFADIYSSRDANSSAMKKFFESYRQVFGFDPTSMEVLAYDAASILKSILEKDAPRSRDELRNRLRDLKNFPGIAGKVSYQDGAFSRPLKVLTVKKGQFVEADSVAPR